jgi:hypothetical protein
VASAANDEADSVIRRVVAEPGRNISTSPLPSGLSSGETAGFLTFDLTNDIVTSVTRNIASQLVPSTVPRAKLAGSRSFAVLSIKD